MEDSLSAMVAWATSATALCNQMAPPAVALLVSKVLFVTEIEPWRWWMAPPPTVATLPVKVLAVMVVVGS